MFLEDYINGLKTKYDICDNYYNILIGATSIYLFI